MFHESFLAGGIAGKRKVIRWTTTRHSFRLQQREPLESTAGLKALKLLGVEGIELPIFWGVVEKEAAGKYDWSGYLAVAEIVKKMGLKLHASLSFHGLGFSLERSVRRFRSFLCTQC